MVPCVLFELDDFRFKKILRVTKQTFCHLLELIRFNPVFYGKNSCKQLPISHQLAITLYKLGCYGENLTKTGMFLGIGDGGTTQRIMLRVFHVILSLAPRYLYWPNVAERQQIVLETLDEMPGSIGYVDGSEIILFNKPASDHESYYSRKSNYCLKVQVVGDHNRKVRHIVLGYPGSVHDARVYANCDLAVNPQNYFDQGQYLLGDKAYRLTETVITPYKGNSRTNLPHEMINKFNTHLSSYRIRIEHLFGILTERFQSLKELRVLIKDVDSLKYALQWIYCSCVLHNIIIELGFEELDLNDGPEAYLGADEPQDHHENVGNANRAAIMIRNQLATIVFNQH